VRQIHLFSGLLDDRPYVPLGSTRCSTVHGNENAEHILLIDDPAAKMSDMRYQVTAMCICMFVKH
jgi:hypothetical protein